MSSLCGSNIETENNTQTSQQQGLGDNGTGYKFLAPIPTNPSKTFTDLSDYLKYAFITIVGASVIISVVMITLGGIQYMNAITPSGKETGKKKILGAIGGLLLVIFSYLILQTINPKLLSVGLDLKQITISDYNADIADVLGTNVGRGITTDSTGTGAGNGSCAVVQTDSCAPSNLEKYFPGEGIAMSKICNRESRANPTSASNSDCCGKQFGPNEHGPGCKKLGLPSFSIGLFQINLTVTDTKNIPGWGGVDCTKAFNGKNSSCRVVDQSLYSKCVQIAQDPEANSQAAKYLYYTLKQGKGAWVNSRNACGV